VLRPGLGGSFLGSGHITAGELIADRLLSPAEVASLRNTLLPAEAPERAAA